MLLLFPAVGAFLLLPFTASQAHRLGFPDVNRRGVVVISFLLFQLVTVAIAEGLSIGGHYTTTTVSVCWAVVDVGLAAAAWQGRSASGARPGGARSAFAPLEVRRAGPDVIAGVVVLSGFFLVLGVIAWLYPPSNSDSMAYHLARVEHWIQNESVASYATHFLHQIELAPLMEYDVATLHLLLGRDRLDGYVQLVSLLVCVLAASDLARRLGLGARGQVLAALLVVTAQNVLLEATSTTNGDFCGAVAIGTLWVATSPLGGSGWARRGVALGLCAGLMELSKGTLVALFGPVLLVVLVVAWAAGSRRWGPRQALARAAVTVGVAAVAALAVAGPFLVRNIELFGSPGGPISQSTVDDAAPLDGRVGNTVRQVSAQFLIGDGSGPEHAVSNVVTGALGDVYAWLGADPEDERDTLVPNPDPFEPPADSTLSRFEDVGANPWHTLLAVIAVVTMAVCAVRRREWLLPLALSLALCAGFVALTMTAKWSIYATRYYVPLLVVWAPLLALSLRPLPRVVTRGIAVLLVVACLPQLFDNYQRSLVHPRYHFESALEPYFAVAVSAEDARARAKPYEQLSRTLAASRCHELGLGNVVLLEYPVWVGLDRRDWRGRIESVGVLNKSRELAGDVAPCAVLYDGEDRNLPSALPNPPVPTTTPRGMTRFDYGYLTLFVKTSLLAGG